MNSRHIITLLTWNRLDLTKQTMRSFWKFNGKEHNVLCFDNGSKDGTANWLEKHGVEVIRSEKNIGIFRATRNAWMTAHERGYEFILNLQNDFPSCREVPFEDCYQLMDSHSDVGFVLLNNKKYGLYKENQAGKIKQFVKKTEFVENKYTRDPLVEIRVKMGSTKFLVGNHHFTFNPTFFRSNLVKPIVGEITLGKEWQIFEEFNKTGFKSARLKSWSFDTILRSRYNGWTK